MTEERIKELAEEYANRWDIDEAQGWSQIALAALIRTVAAEARKEGIEELLRYATERKIDIRGSRYVALNIVEGGAERLKEQAPQGKEKPRG